MGLIYTPESAMGKEMAKWNKPYHYQPFPKMLFRAHRPASGAKIQADEQIIVENAIEMENMLSRGFFDHPTKAIEAVEKAEIELADVTAARHYEDRRLGELAKREARAADQATEHHVPEVPRTPVKRGRKPKAQPPTTATE